MKICIKCNRTYSDESLAFCLECGSSLNTGSKQGIASTPTAVMTPTQFGSPLPTAQAQPNMTAPQYTPIAQTQPQTPSYQPPYSERPSNAGRLLAILCILLTVGGLLFFTIAMFGSASKIMGDTAVGALVLLAMFIPAFGTLIGLFALYRAFRNHDGKGAKKTAILGIIINLFYVLGFVVLMTIGALSLFFNS
jgi:hypothetical protein